MEESTHGGYATKEARRLRFKRPAMAAMFEIIFDIDREERQLHDMADASFELVHHLERQLSSYIGGSDISYINQTAAERPARIVPDLFELLKTARRLYDETDGAFDITVGPLVRAWGFFKREGRIPDPETLKEAREGVGMDNVVLDDEEYTVRFTKPGVEINLGAIGKGYVVDRVIAQLREWDVRCALVHSGQSAIAVIGKPPNDDGWRVGVADPRNPEEALGSLLLVDSTMSISGSWEQFFEVDGKRYSHILDPRTGQPAQGILSTTVTGPSATISDALSTAFFVMGVEQTRAYCEKHEEIGAVIIAGESPQTMEVHAIGCKLENLEKEE